MMMPRQVMIYSVESEVPQQSQNVIVDDKFQVYGNNDKVFISSLNTEANRNSILQDTSKSA